MHSVSMNCARILEGKQSRKKKVKFTFLGPTADHATVRTDPFP